MKIFKNLEQYCQEKRIDIFDNDILTILKKDSELKEQLAEMTKEAMYIAQAKKIFESDNIDIHRLYKIDHNLTGIMNQITFEELLPFGKSKIDAPDTPKEDLYEKAFYENDIFLFKARQGLIEVDKKKGLKYAQDNFSLDAFSIGLLSKVLDYAADDEDPLQSSYFLSFMLEGLGRTIIEEEFFSDTVE